MPTYDYDPTNDVGKVRLLIPDRGQGEHWIFSDEEIESFLGMEDGVKRAAALALETISTDEALVQKVISSLEIRTDGAKLAEALLKRCELLRSQAELDDIVGDDDSPLDWAELVTGPFSYREKVEAEYLRGL